MTAVDNKTRYQRLKAAGLCVSCGKDVAAENNVRCERCRDKNRIINKKSRILGYHHRLYKHECVDCGEKLPPDYYYVRCQKCHKKNKVCRKKCYARRKNEQVK